MKRAVWKIKLTQTYSRADKTLLEALEKNLGFWEGAPRKISRSFLQKLIEEKRVCADHSPIKANSKLKTGMSVVIDFPEPEAIEVTPENLPIDILYEDENLLVLNKPQSLTVHPSATQKTGTLVHALLHHVKDLSGIGGKLRPGIVHRLDKDTSGALLITKTDEAHRKLVVDFSKHDIDRSYLALCFGAPEFNEKKIETLIGRNPKDRKKMSTDVKTGRKAVSLVKVIERFKAKGGKPFASLVQVKLMTGRTHQVRVHLTHLGFSILGDPVYGKPTTQQSKWLSLPKAVQALVARLPGQALHAQVLGFKHPITEKMLRFEAKPPELFYLLHEELRKYL